MYDADFQGDDVQPAMDSPEAEVFRTLVTALFADPNSITLVKCDWRPIGSEDAREVTALVWIESEGGSDGTVVRPLAVLIDDQLGDELAPHGGHII